MFEKIKVNKLNFKAENLPKQPTGNYTLPCLTSSFKNQGLIYYVPEDGATILKNVISIPSNSDVYRAYFQSNEFTVLSDAYAMRWVYNDVELLPNQYLFAVLCINKVTDLSIYSYKNKLGGWNVVKNKYLKLPVKNGEIDLAFMDDYVSNLEGEHISKLKAYLSVAGLNNCTLTTEELKILNDYSNMSWSVYNLEKLFGKSTRGKRLKSADRVDGDLPFVTAGETEEGVSAFISNNVTVFPENTVTIDMFGSAKYRNYKYGGDDHVAVVHTEVLSKFASIFVTASIHKVTNSGKFDYSRNFYAKDADETNISLPTHNGKPDYARMAILISAVHKLMIKDVVSYVNDKKHNLNNPS